MIFIEKMPSKEAKAALSTYIKKEGEKAHYKNFKQADGKGEVQKSLVAEQYYLCAYCMRRIHESEKIEHWQTQEFSQEAENAHETLNYNNLLAVCHGISIHPLGQQEHCDQSRSKSNRVLTVNPSIKATVDQIKYLKNGTIHSTNNIINDDLDKKDSLNLNTLTLKDERKNVYETFKKLRDIKCRGKSEEARKTIIQKLIESWKTPQYNSKKERYELEPFCGIIRYFFDKK